MRQASNSVASRPPAIDLKLRLALRVAALAAICFIAVAAYALFDSDRVAKAKASRIAEIVARDLSLQQSQAQWLSVSINATPDLQGIAALMEPGLCIAYRDNAGAFRQGVCSGALADDIAAPEIFAVLYRAIFRPGEPISMPVLVAGSARGMAVATFDPATQIGQSWREASRLLSIMAFALAGLCVAVYAALARALRPTRAIGAGLNQLAANDLSARLPRFDLAELSVISGVFNTLAERLQTTLAERNALTRKLIEVQDEERRHLARELHDEFGQSLSAIAAQAAAAAHTAERECPPLYEECRGISRTTAHMMETLRGALVRLRPPDVEELGLTLSLESLVASWNGFEKGRTRFEIAVIGEADDLPPGVSASLYRIAQEAITNAAKHAHARRVQLASRGRRRRHRPDRRGRRRSGRRQPHAESRHGTARHAGARGFARRDLAIRAAGGGRRPACRAHSHHAGGALDMAALDLADTAGRTRVMLADDHAIVREGYRSLLQKQDRLQVVAEADNGADAYRVYKEARPDLVIMDLSMPGIGGVEAIRRIRQWDKSARILVFTMHQSAAYAIQAIKAGARGFVTKSNPPEALLRAITEVMAGRIALSPDIDHELAINRLADEPSAIDALSPREFEILRMLLAEKSVDEIANTLHISVKTAANTRYQIRAKLGVGSDIELVRLALRQRIIAAEDIGS